VEQTQKVLDSIGIGGQRLQMYNLSSSDGPSFARYAEEMHGRIVAAGPNPVRKVLEKRRKEGTQR
jgi:coenzyme F420-reducing hydrogenase delta subunit